VPRQAFKVHPRTADNPVQSQLVDTEALTLKILVIDVGGTNVKILASGQREARKQPSGKEMSAQRMASAVKELAADWKYDAVSIGYPGPVIKGRPLREPHNLGSGWVDFDFEKAFKRPVKMINDAAMQALGSYEKGTLLFLGLGTGLGSALVIEGRVQPLELAHLPYRKGTFEDYVGLRGLEKRGKKKWREHVADVVEHLSAACLPDDIVLGGGNAKKLDVLPPRCRLGVASDAHLRFCC
jgi:polyphosphate glucokinase